MASSPPIEIQPRTKHRTIWVDPTETGHNEELGELLDQGWRVIDAVANHVTSGANHKGVFVGSVLVVLERPAAAPKEEEAAL
jgi:hypothetical protein